MDKQGSQEPARLRFPSPIAWLEERQGTPYGASHCRTVARDVQSAGSLEELTLAVARHGQGTKVIDLLTHGAPRVLGRATVDEFLERDCGLEPRRAYEIINYAAGTTEEEAKRFLYSRCLVGVELAKAVGCASLTLLASRELTLTHDDGRVETVRFARTTPVSRLRAVLAQLRTPEKDEPVAPKGAVARRHRRFEAVVSKHLEASPELGRLNVRAVVYAGRSRVQHAWGESGAEFDALGRLYQDVAKVR